MLRIAICDDDCDFANNVENLVINESLRLGIRSETDVFSDGQSLLNAIHNGERYSLMPFTIHAKPKYVKVLFYVLW